MAESILLTEAIVVVISLIILLLCFKIYTNTKGGSRTYYFWALGTALTFIGALISFFASFFLSIHDMHVGGIEAYVVVLHLSFTLMGYYYIAAGALNLPAELKITKTNLDRFLAAKKYVLLGILLWSFAVSVVIYVSDSDVPVRLFYISWYAVAWMYTFFALYPFYTVVNRYARYWMYLMLGILFGFFANIGEILAYLISDSLLFLSPLLYLLMAVFLIIGFSKLGKDIGAF